MTIEQRVRKVIVENAFKGEEPEGLTAKSPLVEYGVGLDSVATLELVVALEEEFKTRIDESELSAEIFETIETISKDIAKRL